MYVCIYIYIYVQLFGNTSLVTRNWLQIKEEKAFS